MKVGTLVWEEKDTFSLKYQAYIYGIEERGMGWKLAFRIFVIKRVIEVLRVTDKITKSI